MRNEARNRTGDFSQIFGCGSHVDVDDSLDLIVVNLGRRLNIFQFHHRV